jgi:hypothetical protein
MTISQTAKVSAMLLAFLLGSETTPASAVPTPTPVPGGANQKAGVSGTLAQVLFNGKLRLRAMSLKDPVATDNMHANNPGDRPLVLHAIVSNGTQHEDHGFFNATLADANGITVTGRPLDEGWGLEQGTAARIRMGFSVPADFVPTKLVLSKASAPNDPAFRITIRPGDVPAASSAPPSS